MLVHTVSCPTCNREGELLVLDEQKEEYLEWVRTDYLDRPLVHVALPSWTPEMREQLLTGFHPRCWEKTFGDLESV